MSIYRVEGPVAYLGARKYKTGTAVTAGVYTESFPAKTELRPYGMRKIGSSRLYPGYVVDGVLVFGDGFVHMVPQVVKSDVVIGIIRELLSKNPYRDDLNPDKFSSLVLPDGHIYKEKGLRVILPYGSEEFMCRIIVAEGNNIQPMSLTLGNR